MPSAKVREPIISVLGKRKNQRMIDFAVFQFFWPHETGDRGKARSTPASRSPTESFVRITDTLAC